MNSKGGISKEELKRLIEVANKKIPADIVLRGGKIVDVFSGTIREEDVAICGRRIAGIGNYDGKKVIDLGGQYISPGLIDSHIHIESSHLCPEEFSKMAVCHGTTSVIADPHEIVNVCGMEGYRYMKRAGEKSLIHTYFMIPSCVPATPKDDSGATILAKDMEDDIEGEDVPGLGEMMDFHGVIAGDDAILDKILLAMKKGKVVDGHVCGLMGSPLNAYMSTGIATDHECVDPEEMTERMARGMYVQLRLGTACHNLPDLAKGLNSYNYRRALICSDDMEPDTIIKEGCLERHLRILVESGRTPIEAISMATINPCDCYGIRDRGGIAPGRFADLVIFNNLETFDVKKVFVDGKIVFEEDKLLLDVESEDIAPVANTINVSGYDKERLKLKLDNDRALCIGMMPGGVLSEKRIIEVKRDDEGYFSFDPNTDAVKCAVIERHKGTGKIGLGLLTGYGLKKGAVALTIAHDSHNIICAGASDEDMDIAIRAIMDIGGGIVIASEGNVIESLPLPIAGLMSDRDGAYVAEKLDKIQTLAYEKFDINRELSPVMTLCFMSLLVIPELKLTPGGLFDVFKNSFVDINDCN